MSFCHSHDRLSSQVRPLVYDARRCGSRFLEVDPIEGGLDTNDYEYVAGDPANKFDLDGACIQVWQKRCRGKKSWWHKTGGVARSPLVQVGVTALACGFGGAIGCGIANYGFAAVNTAGRYSNREGFSRRFLASGAIDFGFASVKYWSLSKLRHGRSISLVVRSLATGWNAAWGAALSFDRYAISRRFGL